MNGRLTATKAAAASARSRRPVAHRPGPTRPGGPRGHPDHQEGDAEPRRLLDRAGHAQADRAHPRRQPRRGPAGNRSHRQTASTRKGTNRASVPPSAKAPANTPVSSSSGPSHRRGRGAGEDQHGGDQPRAEVDPVGEHVVEAQRHERVPRAGTSRPGRRRPRCGPRRPGRSRRRRRGRAVCRRRPSTSRTDCGRPGTGGWPPG